jgi:siderophore synthetase component
MLIEALDTSPETFLELERYCNDGSPSGFSDKYTPHDGFRASDPVSHFPLPLFALPEIESIEVGTHNTSELRGRLPVHPDMVDLFLSLTPSVVEITVDAVATSSGRTLYAMVEDGPVFLKLSYQGMLGRVTRRMTHAHVLSAVEVSAAYERAILEGRLPTTFCVYREIGGIAFAASSPLGDWGYVVREASPFPAPPASVAIPSFAMFSRLDSTEGDTLLGQVVRKIWGPDPRLFFDRLLQPLVECYFASIRATGLQLEAHAQNVILLFGKDYELNGVAFRDMESIDKDLPMLDRLDESRYHTPTGYKFMSADDYNYTIKHSFMYDFKFGEYLLRPLIAAWSRATGLSEDIAAQSVREYARGQIEALPADFFPEGVWFDYAPVVHEGQPRRSYLEHPDPIFR